MIRALLTTTAVTALLTTGAFAADQAKTATDQPTMAGSSIFETDAPALKSSDGYFQATQEEILASALIGQSVYTGTGDNAESVGEVNDVVLGPNGAAEAVVIGVGGFLGVGEKEVAIDFDRISWTDRNGDKYLTASATKKELESAPEFDRSVFEPKRRDMMTSMADRNRNPAAVVPAAPGANPNQAANGNTMSGDTMARDNNAANQGSMASNGQPADTKAMASNQKMAANHEGETRVDPSILSADDLIGTAVYGANDSELGEVNDVIVSPDGKLVAYILDVGGFLGLGAKPVALDANKLQITKDGDGDMHIYTSLTENALKAYPTYSEEAYKANPDAVVVH